MSDWPSLDEIDRCWQGVVDGVVSQMDAHNWTVPWVEGDRAAEGWSDIPAPTMDGLQGLHGVSMSSQPATPHLVGHGPPGEYLLSLEDVGERRRWWRQDRALFEGDPAACPREVEARIARVRQEQSRRDVRKTPRTDGSEP